MQISYQIDTDKNMQNDFWNLNYYRFHYLISEEQNKFDNVSDINKSKSIILKIKNISDVIEYKNKTALITIPSLNRDLKNKLYNYHVLPFYKVLKRTPEVLHSEMLFFSYPFIEKKEKYCKVYNNGRSSNLK